MSLSNRFPILITAAALCAVTASAASVDMNEPHRAMRRENDIRVDAQLLSEVVSNGTPIAVTYQIQNFTDFPVAVAEKVCDASYDSETRTITVAVGSEIPPGGQMPKMATIGPGEKKTFSTATTLKVAVPAGRSPVAATPRWVQIKVNILRNLAPFRELLMRPAAAPAAELSDTQFEQWLEGNDTIYLNTLPVRFESRRSSFDASQRHGGM